MWHSDRQPLSKSQSHSGFTFRSNRVSCVYIYSCVISCIILCGFVVIIIWRSKENHNIRKKYLEFFNSTRIRVSFTLAQTVTAVDQHKKGLKSTSEENIFSTWCNFFLINPLSDRCSLLHHHFHQSFGFRLKTSIRLSSSLSHCVTAGCCVVCSLAETNNNFKISRSS